ncbi:MAG: hypothetical protein PHE33_02520 [Bacteroidales bacterium]|nr:hypothetical protein [Bacteroidales bacterium]
MDIKKITDNFVKIIINPALGWKKPDFTDLNFKNILFPLLTGLLLLTFASRLVGKSLAYLSDSSIQHIMTYAFLSLIVDFVFFIGLVFVINELLPFYDLKKNKTKVAILLLASISPFYASIIVLNIFPSLFFLGIVSLYSFYILFWGIRNFLKIKRENEIIFFIISILLMVGIYLILHFAIIYPFFEFVI